MKRLYLLSTLLLVMAVAMLPQNVKAQVPVWDGTWEIWTHGNGTQADPYLIETPQHLAWLARKVNDGTTTFNGVHFRLTTDLDMNSLEWSPIGNSTTNRFKGTFDGNGHYIDNIYMLIVNNDNRTYLGLFGIIDGATITNLGVNTTIICQEHNSSLYEGGLVGYIYSGYNNISNCYNNGALGSYNSSSDVGGLIGYINSTTFLSGCNNTANVGSYNPADYCGGIVGRLSASTTIIDCHNSGNVRSYYGSGNGGIVGSVSAETTITNCSNKGVISASGSWGHTGCPCGGLIGYVSTTGTIIINNSHNEGNVSGISAGGLNGGVFSSSDVGGLVGYSNSSLNVTNCYNSGTLSLAQCLGGLVGYTANSVSLANCYNKGNMNTSNNSTLYGGGLIGYNYAAASILHSFNKGNVTVSTYSYFNNTGSSSTAGYIYPSAYSGGIVGYSDKPIVIEQCYNAGSISTSTDHNKNNCIAGGITGLVSSTGNNIKECYNTGTVSGRNSGGISGRTSEGTSITNSYNTGSLGGSNPMGTVGYNSNSPTITNCYYLNTCGGGASTGSVSMTAPQMKSTSFPGMLNDGVQAYIMDMTPNINQGYPIFGNMIYAITQSATNVGATKATLNGSYSGLADMVGFQYRMNATSSEWNTIYASSGSPVSFQLNSLSSSTTYVFRIMVMKNGASFYGDEMTFTTGSCNLTASVTPSSVTICEGETATLTASGQSVYSNLFSYNWNTGETSPSVSVMTGGEHTVTVSDTNGCTATASSNVTVRPLPTVNISGNTSLCAGENGQLTASGGNSYIWNTGETTPSITVTQGGHYSVTATNSYGCSSTQSSIVTVFGSPVITGNTAFCPGSYTTLTATGGDTYQWSTGATTPSINVNTAGTYTVTVTTNNGCSGSTSVTVIQNQVSNVNISGNTVICSGIGTTLTASSGINYLWSTGETSQSINANIPGTYSVTVTNSNGCSKSATQSVSLMEQVTISGNNHICSGQNTTLMASGSGNYAWSNGSSSSSITVSELGNYTVTVTLSNGCSSSASIFVTTATTPTPTISGNTTFCQGETSLLTANGGNSYLWSNGSTNNSIGVSQSGTYSVTATSIEGCTGSTSTYVTVNPLPNVSISGNNSFCQGGSVSLMASGASSYSWSNGSNNATITVSNPGTYTVIGTNAAGCSATTSKTVTVNPSYNIPLSQSICQGETYNFNGQYLTTAGSYTQSLSTVNGCDSIITLTLTVKALPSPTISGNTVICQGQSTTLTANGGTSYIWSNASTNSSINVSQSGVYTVTATNAEGCSNTANVTVTVNPLPAVNISGNNTFCQGDNVTLTATGASTYVWSNASTNASITVSNAGTYTVTGTNANGCSNTATKAVSVNPTYIIPLTHSICQGESYNFYGQNITAAGTYTHRLQTVNGCDSVLTLTVTLKALPTATITGNTTLCEGETTTLLAAGGTSYSWSNAATTNSINVSQSGVYTVTATNAEGCSNSANVTITVNPLPNVSISGNNSFCQGDNTTLMATGANTYLWSNSSTYASITVNSAGNYTVTGTDANGCSNTATNTVTVNPTYNIPLTHSICQGESYNFYGQNITAAGTYTHTLQTVNGCDSVLTLVVTLKALPPTAITGNTTLCEGESTTLVATGGVSYAWSNGGTSNSTTVNQSGVYTVIATNAEGCSATANVTVTVNPLPTITIGGNTTVCAGNSTMLTASGANSYSWSTGDNTASVNIDAFGVYTVTGTTSEGCSNTASVTVLVSQLPNITITGMTDMCAGESTTLTANGGETYLWSDGTTNNTLTASMAGTYQVIGYNVAGCNAMASTTVNVWQPATSEFSVECPDSCYTWNSQTYCTSGTYTQTLQTVHGCDSVVTLHLTITVGIDDYNLGASMTVYPNPTTSVVNVQCTMYNVHEGTVEFQLFDAFGRLLRSTDGVETRCTTSLQTRCTTSLQTDTHGSSVQTAQIDLSHYAAGVYFVKAVADGNVVAVRKMVKR